MYVFGACEQPMLSAFGSLKKMLLFGKMVVFLLCFTDSTRGLSCLTCSTTTSLQSCYANGAVKRCWPSAQMCYTEIRYERPSQETGLYRQKLVTAGCKQNHACLNEEGQNPRNCYHEMDRIPQRCYRCCKSPECVGIRVERHHPLCQEALHTFFKRFDTNHDGIVDAGEAKLQAEIRKMKNLAFFVALLAEKTDFHDRGADFEAFQQTMVAWFEELKIVADRDGNGMVSLPELQLFALEHQKLTNDRAGSAASQMFSLVSRLAKEQLELDLCEFIKAYAKDLSKQQTICKSINAPKFGTKSCTNSSIAGSKCHFKCHAGYDLFGNDHVTCSEDGQWQGNIPSCRRIECYPKIKKPTGGELTCTNSNFAFSQCRIMCDKENGYSLTGSAVSTCTERSVWSQPAGCCNRPCPPYATIDLILIFDSSSSVGAKNWKKLIKFGGNIVGTFNVARKALRVGAFRYNKYVDVNTEIKLGEVRTFEEFETRLQEIPYDGSGTLTGKAIQHARDQSLKVEDNRPDVKDVVLLFTDGASGDNATEPAAALKAKGVEITVIGIENQFGRLDDTQMRQVASSPVEDHFMVISGGFDSLTQRFVKRISKLVCGDPCKHLRT